MRIGLVLEQFDPLRGGLEQWTFQFARALVDRGHEVHVVAKGFKHHSSNLEIVPHAVEPSAMRGAFAAAVEARLRTLDLDIIHDMGCGWYGDVFHPHGGSWLAGRERMLCSVPSWLRSIKRQVDPWLPRIRQCRALVARQFADGGQTCIALSRVVARDFQVLHRVAPHRIRMIYNGVDTERFSPGHRETYREPVRRGLGIDEGTVVALIIAHNFRLKGVPALLAAMKKLAAEHEPLHLLVVGGKRLSGWQRRAARLGVDDKVTFVGRVDDTVPYLAAADFYAHPTFYDPCSLVLLEAAASGLPLLTSRRFNGVAELIEDGEEGILIDDPADANELAQGMRRLGDESVRQQMGWAARRLALRHTFEGNVDAMLAVYREILARREVGVRRLAA